MRHSTKYREKTWSWDVGDVSFSATKYRAKLDSNQVTIKVEQYDNEYRVCKMWLKSFRAIGPVEADLKAEDYVMQVKSNSMSAQNRRNDETKS